MRSLSLTWIFAFSRVIVFIEPSTIQRVEIVNPHRLFRGLGIEDPHEVDAHHRMPNKSAFFVASSGLLIQRVIPLGFPKADQDKAFADQERAFDQHSVAGKEFEHFVFGHRGEFVF